MQTGVGGAVTLPAAVSREDGQQRQKPQTPFIGKQRRNNPGKPKLFLIA